MWVLRCRVTVSRRRRPALCLAQEGSDAGIPAMWTNPGLADCCKDTVNRGRRRRNVVFLRPSVHQHRRQRRAPGNQRNLRNFEPGLGTSPPAWEERLEGVPSVGPRGIRDVAWHLQGHPDNKWRGGSRGVQISLLSAPESTNDPEFAGFSTRGVLNLTGGESTPSTCHRSV